MKRYKKPSQPGDIVPTPGVIDELGRAKGVGRRKTSSAVAWLVEGEGEVLINGQSLTEYFGRLHHRESAVWALKATNRLDKYNLFGLTEGGGTTGQAEAMTLAVAKALLVHEPALKPALRRGESNTCLPLPLAPSIFCLLMSCCCCLCARGTHPRVLFMRIPIPSMCCIGGNPLLTLIQLAVSLVTQGRWRGRSPVTSRPARCLPGSSAEGVSLCISTCISSYLMAFSGVECKMKRPIAQGVQLVHSPEPCDIGLYASTTLPCTRECPHRSNRGSKPQHGSTSGCPSCQSSHDRYLEQAINGNRVLPWFLLRA